MILFFVKYVLAGPTIFPLKQVRQLCTRAQYDKGVRAAPQG